MNRFDSKFIEKANHLAKSDVFITRQANRNKRIKNNNKLNFKKNCENLNNPYVKFVASQKYGIEGRVLEENFPEIIELKRLELYIHRLKKTIKEIKNESST